MLSVEIEIEEAYCLSNLTWYFECQGSHVRISNSLQNGKPYIKSYEHMIKKKFQMFANPQIEKVSKVDLIFTNII